MGDAWLEHYDAGVPRSIGSYPEKTLVDFVREHAVARGHAPAIAFKGLHISFRDLDRASDALAHSLSRLGVKRGDRVCILLPNVPQFLVSELAVWKLGAIIAPQNPIYTERELEQSVNTSNAEVAIVLTAFYDRLKHIQPRTTLKTIIATNIKEYLPRLVALAFTLLKEKKDGHRITLREGDFWLRDLMAEGSKSGTFESIATPSDAAIILMSGGTTGTPKGVISDHRSVVMSGTQLSAWLREPLTGDAASIMLPLPLFHTYGCAGAQSITMINAIPLILVPNPRDVGDLLKTISRERPALLCGVPALFSALMAHPDVKKVDFRSIKGCFSGAAALMAETKRRFEELTGGVIVEGYSLTEATMACCANPHAGANKIGSVGMPLPDVRVRIVDSEDPARELPPKEVGEIVMSAPQLMRGYCNNVEETAQILRLAADGSTWLFTGDLGYLDEDGYLFIVDRKKDLIKAGGFQVWPREIEEVIATHPAVADVGVAGVAHPRKGEVIIAWVVLQPGMTVTEDALRKYCRDNLTHYKVPASFQFRSELPKTMIGKVLRRVLVAEAKEQIETLVGA